MQLTLEQAATRLGKSERQVRYMIRLNRIPAEKIAGRWFIDSKDLPLNENQRGSSERKQRQLRAAVEEALEVSDEDSKERDSVRKLKAIQIILPLYRRACDEFSNSHPAALALNRALEHLCRGCHRYQRAEKADSYRAARDETSLAICELLLVDSQIADELIEALEQDLMAALSGLMRITEPKSKRS